METSGKKGASTIEISAIIILVVVIGILVWRYYVNASWYKQARDGSLYLTSVGHPEALANNSVGTTELPGQDILLKCPVGYDINIKNVFVSGAPTVEGDNTCWKALSKASPGYPQSGTPIPTTGPLKNIQNKYNGKNSATINLSTSPDSDMDAIITQFYSIYSDLKPSPTQSCTVALDGQTAWSPMVTCLYECSPSSS